MRLALSGLCLVAMSSLAPQALAQIILAPVTECGTTTPGGSGNLCDEISAPHVATGQTCGFARGATGCTANDFVGNANVTSNTVTDCHKGDVLTNQALSFVIQSSPSNRYAPGLFIGEQGQPLNAAGGTCTVATFPTASVNPLPARVPYPWFAANVGDTCGSYSGSFTSIEMIDGVTFTCDPDVNNNPQLTFMVVYAQNAGGASLCTGPGNVAPGTTSKCTFGGTPITNVVVTYNANPTCSGSLTYDPVAHTVSATFHVTNSGPDEAGPLGAGSVTFTDTVPAPATVTGATCGNPLGGAVCGTTGFVGNVVSGTIDSLPAGGSVDITINGTVPPNPGNVTLNDTFELAVDGVVVTVPAQWLNTCVGSAQLPVHLQDFDVK
jgi:hypothetical protein